MAEKKGGLVSPHSSTKIGKVPSVAGNTFVSDIKVMPPSSFTKSGTSTSFPKR